MENNLPKHITNEKDLQYFEDFLSDAKNSTANNNNMPQQKRNTNNTAQRRNMSQPMSSDSLPKFLCDHIGKQVRVDFLIGDRRESRTGTLFKVGKDFIVLKPMQSNTTLVCDINSIKFITVIHVGNKRR